MVFINKRAHNFGSVLLYGSRGQNISSIFVDSDFLSRIRIARIIYPKSHSNDRSIISRIHERLSASNAVIDIKAFGAAPQNIPDAGSLAATKDVWTRLTQTSTWDPPPFLITLISGKLFTRLFAHEAYSNISYSNI